MAVQADPPSIQTWSIRCGLRCLERDGTIDLRHGAAVLAGERGVWLEILDREAGRRKSIHIDVGDRADPNSVRAGLADGYWARNWTGGRGRPLGLVAPMRLGVDYGPRYVSALARSAARNRRLRDVKIAASGLRPPWPVRLRSVSSEPSGGSQVLYQVVAWEPQGNSADDGRLELNAARAELIAALRDAFGPRFVGGFVPTPYAWSRFPELVTDQPSGKEGYLSLVRSSRVVVAGVGLHSSTPWKLAEYVATSRAVVCARLPNPTPEPMDDAFAWFDDTAGAIEQCRQLLADDVLCSHRQVAARQHWVDHVRPDRLVLRRIEEEFAE